MICRARGWDERQFSGKKEDNNKALVWATGFPHLLKLNTRERSLQPTAMVTYRRPPALRNLLTNYKKIARDQSSKDTEGYSQPCGHCALCGNHGKHQSMVCQESYLNTPKGRFKLKQRLTCANYGIYVATCVLCGEQYVGQTKNKFSVRWTAHRSHWAKKQSGNDVGALNKHYHTKHSETIHSSTSFSASYKVTFVEQPPCEDLDWCEDKWLHRINASINLGKMILPDSR